MPTKLQNFVSLDEAKGLALETAIETIKSLAKSSVCSLFVKQGNRLRHEATCTFLNIGGVDYLVTAAHALESKGSYQIALPSGPTAPLSMPYICSVAPNGIRDSDKLDFAYAALCPTWRDLGIVPINFLDIPDGKNGVLLGTVGFASSQNDFGSHRRNIVLSGSAFISEKTEVVSDLPVHPEVHLVARRNPSYQHEGGKRVKPISPKGMSGGLMFEISELDGLDTLGGLIQPRVRPKAIVTELVDNGRAILATRLSYIARAIAGNGRMQVSLVAPPKPW